MTVWGGGGGGGGIRGFVDAQNQDQVHPKRKRLSAARWV